MDFTLLSVFLALYLSAVLLAALGLRRRSSGPRNAALAVLAFAWVGQASVIGWFAWRQQGLPLANLNQFLVLFSWVVLTLHLLLWWRSRIEALGVVLPPLGALFLALAMAVSTQPSAGPGHGREAWFILHGTAATLGLAALGVAFATSLIYLIQDHTLKNKRSLGVLERLPSLAVSDQIGQQALLWGFVLLSSGIVTGMIGNVLSDHRVLSLRVKELFPLIAWAVFALLLLARRVWGYRGRRAALITIAGFAVGLLTIVGLAQ